MNDLFITKINWRYSLKKSFIAFFNLLVVILIAEIEPIKAAVQDTLRNQTSKVIQTICYREYLCWECFGCLEHFGEPSREVITVELKQIISITFLTKNLFIS